MLLGLRKPNPYRELEARLGYRFKKREFLDMAMLHRSYRFEARDVETDNQRLEFLGDAVVGFLVAAHVYRTHHSGDEGTLTELRTRATSGKALAGVARQIELGRFLRLGKGEEQGGGRFRENLLADGMEAVIGAAYLDGGVRAAEKIVVKLLLPLIAGIRQEPWQENPKGKLQELSQRMYGGGPEYRCVSEEGPPHEKRFVVEVRVGGALLGRGEGSSKRTAEAEAAHHAVSRLLSG